MSIGRKWLWDEGQGGAYFLEGDKLCYASYDPGKGRFEWDTACEVDSRDLLSGDPGWDYANFAERTLLGEIDTGLHWCEYCGNEGHTADDCDEAPEEES